MSTPNEWGDPEPFGVDEDGEVVLWNCPNPDCSTQKDTEEKAADHCANENVDSPETPNENTAKGQSRDAKGGCEADKSGSGSASDGWIDDPDFDGSGEAVREHYQRVREVYETFADLDGYPTAGFAGNSGWYRYRRENELDIDTLDAGHRMHRRAYTFERDYDRLVRDLEEDPDDGSWRSTYNITSWKDSEAVYEGAFAAAYDEYEQGDGLAGYGDMRGYGLWGDLDLADNDDGADGPNYKQRRGQLGDGERETVETALAAYVEEFADLVGCDPEDVAVFDSGGGAYLYAPAAVTLPIADRYDDDHGPHGDARALVFRELRARMFAYATGTAVNANADDYGFEGIQTRVDERVPGATDLLDPDWMQNRNRQSKSPLSIHGDHDVVVTPARDASGEFSYEPTRVSAVDDDLIERTGDEAAKIIAVPDREERDAMTETFVSTLFAEFYDRDGVTEWTDALDAWLTEKRDRERARVHQTALDERRQRERLDERREEIAAQVDKDPADVTVADAYTGLAVTDVQKDVFDALENPAVVDVRDVIRNQCSDAWNTSNRGHETTFDPSWRGSSSGMSCAVPNAENGFVDNGCDGGGGPAKAYALGNGVLPETENAAAMPLRGRKWGESVDGLRQDGANIPLYVPPAGATNSDGEEYEETPNWGIVKGGVALGVFNADETVYRDAETKEVVAETAAEAEAYDGETYEACKPGTYNDVLDALADAGIDHGREHIDGGVSGDGWQYEPKQCAPRAVESEEYDKRKRWDELQGDRYQAYLDANGPHVWADPAGVGKSTNAERGGAARDRPYFVAFDKHAKARAAITDDATPEGQFHIRGGEQPREDCCMDAAARAVEAHGDETAHCSTHGHPADWPRMCPIYHRSKDDDLRRRYEALVSLKGTLFAHLKLGVLDADEHPWHGGQCWWAEQFDHLLDEDGRPLAERVAGVHEYQLLKSATEGRDIIVDESPRTLATEGRTTVGDLVHARVRLGGLADIHESNTEDELLAENLRALAGFADELTRAIARDDPASFEDLDTRGIQPATFDRPVNPEDLPPEVDPDDVERTAWREYQGVNNDHYTEHERYSAPVEVYDEPLAKAKLAYNEGLVRQYQDTDGDRPTAPFCFDALLAAAAKAGIESDDARKAIAAPEVLDKCPWCGDPLDAANGARVCANEECDWDERENTVTQQDGDRARASAWIDDDPEDLRGDDPALVYGCLPSVEDLPDDPLILDATATPEKVAGLYGARTDEVEVTGDTPLDLGGKFHLTQVVGGRHGRGEDEPYHAGGQYHQQTIKDTPSIQRRIQDTIDMVCDLHERPLFGIKKDLISGFEWPDNAVVVYYSGARGLNYDECDAVCCIGAPHPDMNDIRRQAELLALDHPDLRVGGDEYSTRRNAPNPPVYRKLLYEDENGDGLAVPTKAFSGLVGALFREAHANELEQFIHRIRPHLVDEEEPMKHGYLLTDVPTDLPVNEVAGFEELADPLSALFPAPEGAVRLLGHARDALAGNAPNGFRAGTLVTERDDGTLSNKVAGWHALAMANGMDVTERTVRNWVDALESAGLLTPGEYEQRRGVSYTADISTLKSALQVLSSNGSFKVAAVRRFSEKVRASDGGLGWLAWAEAVFDLSGDRCEWDPPPNPAG